MSGEQGYLDLLKSVLENGEERQTRNAITYSQFGAQLRFNCRESFPLLTTKRVFFRGIIEELLWFIRGDTNADHLADKGVHIWDGNSSREYLDSIGLNSYAPGDCGPVYGYQWRRWNEYYLGPGKNNGEGIDQFAEVVRLIREEPMSRRIFMSGWNPQQLKEMCLPPCHVSYQFYVNSKDELSVSLYQRSADLFLGLPFNIASTATLLYLLCNLCNKKPGDVIISIGDAHIYKDHLSQVKEQLANEIYQSPTLTINKNLESIEDIENLEFSDFVVNDYKCHKGIKAKMVV